MKRSYVLFLMFSFCSKIVAMDSDASDTLEESSDEDSIIDMIDAEIQVLEEELEPLEDIVANQLVRAVKVAQTLQRALKRMRAKELKEIDKRKRERQMRAITRRK